MTVKNNCVSGIRFILNFNCKLPSTRQWPVEVSGPWRKFLYDWLDISFHCSVISREETGGRVRGSDKVGFVRFVRPSVPPSFLPPSLSQHALCVRGSGSACHPALPSVRPSVRPRPFVRRPPSAVRVVLPPRERGRRC